MSLIWRGGRELLGWALRLRWFWCSCCSPGRWVGETLLFPGELMLGHRLREPTRGLRRGAKWELVLCEGNAFYGGDIVDIQS